MPAGWLAKGRRRGCGWSPAPCSPLQRGRKWRWPDQGVPPFVPPPFGDEGMPSRRGLSSPSPAAHFPHRAGLPSLWRPEDAAAPAMRISQPVLGVPRAWGWAHRPLTFPGSKLDLGRKKASPSPTWTCSWERGTGLNGFGNVQHHDCRLSLPVGTGLSHPCLRCLPGLSVLVLYWRTRPC